MNHASKKFSLVPVLPATGRSPREASSAIPSVTSPIRSEEHTSELQSHRDLHSFPTRRSSDLDEPRVEEVLAGSGLAGDRPFTQRGILGYPLGDVPDHDLGCLVGYLGIYDLSPLGLGGRLVEDLISRLLLADDPRERGRLHKPA